jgi:hypothetical protein
VSEPGQREQLWRRRRNLAAAIHERDIVWIQELSWHRDFRHQSWDDSR